MYVLNDKTVLSDNNAHFFLTCFGERLLYDSKCRVSVKPYIGETRILSATEIFFKDILYKRAPNKVYNLLCLFVKLCQ